MSSSATAVGGTPKTLSSKLLTMKFMQRAAASSNASSTTTTTPDEPPAKRHKKGASSTKFDVDFLTDQKAVQAAIAEEEAKKQAALDKQAAELGDTRWVLNFANQTESSQSYPKLRVVHAGFANLDRSGDGYLVGVDEKEGEEDRPVKGGRRSFGKFNPVLEVG